MAETTAATNAVQPTAAGAAKVKSRKKPKFLSRLTGKTARDFLGRILVYLILTEISFMILMPMLSKIAASFMSLDDMYDRTVNFIPRNPTLDNYATVFTESSYLTAGLNTFMLSLLTAFLQCFICAMTGYALAKLKGKVASLVTGIALLTILIPPQIILVPMYLKFRFFDIAGLIGLITGDTISLMDSMWPLVVLSITGFGFKNGLYIFVMRQFFKGVPEEIEEAAYIDGAGMFFAYLRVILPISIPMLITIFMLAFSWQWTDSFYSGIFFSKFKVLANTIFTMSSANQSGGFSNSFMANTILHTGVLFAMAPLIVIYAVAQKWIVTGIERSGIVG